MPQKSKTGKSVTNRPKKLTPHKQETLTSENNSNQDTQELEDQFEVELCWCVQKLETCLLSGKLTDKQAHELGKNINILKSASAPLIKKRQTMRNALGDYRTQMAQDKLKYNRTSSVKFVQNESKKKPVFLRKAVNHSIPGKTVPSENTTDDSSNSLLKSEPCNSKFTFNF